MTHQIAPIAQEVFSTSSKHNQEDEEILFLLQDMFNSIAASSAEDEDVRPSILCARFLRDLDFANRERSLIIVQFNRDAVNRDERYNDIASDSYSADGSNHLIHINTENATGKHLLAVDWTETDLRQLANAILMVYDNNIAYMKCRDALNIQAMRTAGTLQPKPNAALPVAQL